MAEMIAAQGGDPRVTQDTDLLPQAEGRIEITAPESGFVAALKTADIGYAAQSLGAGRIRKSDRIDPAVGIVIKKRLGDPIEKDEAWCELHVNPGSDVSAAKELLDSALTISKGPVEPPKLIHAEIEPQKESKS